MVVHKEHDAKDNLYLSKEAFYAWVFSHFNQVKIMSMQAKLSGEYSYWAISGWLSMPQTTT